MKQVELSELLGETMTHVTVTKDSSGIIFDTKYGECYVMMHAQECCECVEVEDICGDLEDLCNYPITLVEETSSYDSFNKKVENQADSYTWTFYRLSTYKGGVVIRWFGSSNGNYSEKVCLYKVPQNSIKPEIGYFFRRPGSVEIEEFKTQEQIQSLEKTPVLLVFRLKYDARMYFEIW